MPKSSTWFYALFVYVVLFWAPLSQADTGWQPIRQTIHKSASDPRLYQAIQLDNHMTVLLVSDPQAVKSLSALVVPVGSLQDPDNHLGLAHYLEHMTLMGSKKYPQPDCLAEYLKLHGGSHNASTAPTALRSTLKWKTMRWRVRLTALLMPLPSHYWHRNTQSASATQSMRN